MEGLCCPPAGGCRTGSRAGARACLGSGEERASFRAQPRDLRCVSISGGVPSAVEEMGTVTELQRIPPLRLKEKFCVSICRPAERRRLRY